jgi:L,D-peptidoglycan transpeptidase YkuD (ErfK/YbiS/YcfS/YnhG family)
MPGFANKFFPLLLFVSAALTASVAHEQLLFVVAKDMNASTAALQRYEYRSGVWEKAGKRFIVNVGRNGLGWGLGTIPVPHDDADPIKQEGDGRAPAGIFALGPVFGYRTSLDTAMPYRQATGDLICIDDSRSAAYNQIVPIASSPAFGSFEWMRRKDGLYRMGVVVRHNDAALPGRGSCIFLHIQRAPGAGTAGCTSMDASELHTVIQWLDPAKKPLLVLVPAKSLPTVRKMLKMDIPALPVAEDTQ